MTIPPEPLELFRRLKKQNNGNLALYLMVCSLMVIEAMGMVKMAFNEHGLFQWSFGRPF